MRPALSAAAMARRLRGGAASWAQGAQSFPRAGRVRGAARHCARAGAQTPAKRICRTALAHLRACRVGATWGCRPGLCVGDMSPLPNTMSKRAPGAPPRAWPAAAWGRTAFPRSRGRAADRASRRRPAPPQDLCPGTHPGVRRVRPPQQERGGRHGLPVRQRGLRHHHASRRQRRAQHHAAADRLGGCREARPVASAALRQPALIRRRPMAPRAPSGPWSMTTLSLCDHRATPDGSHPAGTDGTRLSLSLRPSAAPVAQPRGACLDDWLLAGHPPCFLFFTHNQHPLFFLFSAYGPPVLAPELHGGACGLPTSSPEVRLGNPVSPAPNGGLWLNWVSQQQSMFCGDWD